jgi:hypothetical protein
VAGELARAIGLAVPEIVLVRLDPELARLEPDPEIQDLIRWSAGLNLALDYLPGALGFDPLVDPPEPELASRILWFDALVANVDRSVRNPNMLVWHEKLWLIDHGASLYFHHGQSGWEPVNRKPYAAVREHVLLPFAASLSEADAALAPMLTPETVRGVVELVPEEWLEDEPGFKDAEAVRSAYVGYFLARLEEPRSWVVALEEAHAGTV